MRINLSKNYIGLIGIGLMGDPIGKRILAGGYSLRIWNRTPDKCDSLVKDGAVLLSSPREVADQVELLLLSLKDDAAVEKVLFGENGVFSMSGKVKIIVDHSTICPSKVRKIAKRVEKLGARYFDSPVTGSVSGAINGTLNSYFGGEIFEAEGIVSVLDLYIKNIKFMGSTGMGQVTKMCNQTVLLNMIISIFEMINLARKSGINDLLLQSAFDESLFDSGAWKIYGHSLLSGCDGMLAPIQNVMKDLLSIKSMGELTNSRTYLTEASLKVVSRLMSQGRGNEDILKLIDAYSS